MLADLQNCKHYAGFADSILEEQIGNVQPNRMIVTLPLVEKNQVVSDKQPRKQPRKQPEKSQEIEQRIEIVLSLIRDNPAITRKELSEQLNLTEQQVRIAIENLKAREIIYHDGPNKGGKWIINPNR